MDLPVAPGVDLFLSLYFPEETGLATYSHKPVQTAHIVGGNHVTSPALPEAEQVEARFYVSGVDVLTPDDTAIAVAFGDSWFEAAGSAIISSKSDVADATARGNLDETKIVPSTSVHRGRTVCRKTSTGLMRGVLTRQPLPEPSCTQQAHGTC